ncbi:MAG: hypothetical protein ABS916_06180 [Carnobacterium sp.]|uniref:hypothetical protein n=1 Tax=Carnobacterium sp. TaxID=48221 RepID=UPI003314E653
MGLMLSEKEILANLEDNGLLSPMTESTAVWAQIMPSTGSLVLFGAYAQLAKGSYFILCMEQDKVILLPVHKVTGKIDAKKEPIIMPFEELDSVEVGKNALLHKVTFTAGERVMPLKINKIAAGTKWHKNNLEKALAEIKKCQTLVVQQTT